MLSLIDAMPAQGFEPLLAAPAQLLAALSTRFKSKLPGCIDINRGAFFDFRPTRRLYNYLRSQNVSIVHSHSFVSSLFASPVARCAGVPAIVETFHLREMWREGKWLKGTFWPDRQLSRIVDQYIAVSDEARTHLLERKRIAPRKVVTIHNGRDLARYRPPTVAEVAEARTALGISDAKVIMVLARLEPQKGHAFLIDAIANLARRWPRLIGCFAGTGSLEAILRKQAANANIGDRIRFLGFRSDSYRLLAAADLVVLPSLFEGLPLVAVEALAMARPFVGTDVDGTREVVTNEESGLLVRPSDSIALAGAIARILEDSALGARLGRRGRVVAELKFDANLQHAKTFDVYRSMLGSRSACLADSMKRDSTEAQTLMTS